MRMRYNWEEPFAAFALFVTMLIFGFAKFVLR
nr:MAG TPA: hypothetical protein [Caudoviricetes sp.]